MVHTRREINSKKGIINKSHHGRWSQKQAAKSAEKTNFWVAWRLSPQLPCPGTPDVQNQQSHLQWAARPDVQNQQSHLQWAARFVHADKTSANTLPAFLLFRWSVPAAHDTIDCFPTAPWREGLVNVHRSPYRSVKTWNWKVWTVLNDKRTDSSVARRCRRGKSSN